MTRAGVETLGVASTKAFTTQLAKMLIIAVIGKLNGRINDEKENRNIVNALQSVPRNWKSFDLW